MDLDDAAAVAAFDVATVAVSIGSRLSKGRQRSLWSAVARSALTGGAAGLAFPGLVAFRDAEGYLWSEDPAEDAADDPAEHARWERAPFQVRRSVVQAVSVPFDASAHLSAALEQAEDLPDESGPLGRDAATVVVASAVLGLGDSLRSQRRALAVRLARRSEQSHDPDVAELGQFVAERLRGAAVRVGQPELPWLMRPEAVLPSLRWRHTVPNEAERHLADVIEQAHLGPVLSRLTNTTYRAAAPGLAVNAPGLGPELTELTGPGSVLGLADRIVVESRAEITPAAVPESPQSNDELNVGLVRADRPDRPIVRGQVRAGTDHLVWASIGPPDPEAVSGPSSPVDLSAVPAADLLTILVFPDRALSVPGAPYWGSVVMGEDRPLPVSRRADHPAVSAERLDSRLYFRVRTPDQPGNYDVRVLVYHRNVLLQARKLTLPVGQAGAHLAIRTPYTLVRSPTAASARELSPRRLCLYVNQSDTGSHQLCFSSLADDNEVASGRLDLEPQEVVGLFGSIRRGLRKASWGSEKLDPAPSEYRYRKRDSGRFAADFAQLELDLCALAQSGYAAWYALTGRLIGGDPGERDPADPDRLRDHWRRRMASPGIIQVSPAHASNLVPPLAGIYDLDVDDAVPPDELRLCPEAVEILRDGGDPAALGCFAAGCRRAGASTVCPSGFWGLRHEIAVPPTLDRSAGKRFRLRAGPRTALVGTVPENLLKGVTDHAKKVRARFGTGDSEHVCSRGEWFKAASQPERRFGVLYFLCHGGESSTAGGLAIFLDPPGESGQSGISESNLKAHHVLLDHHPMVMLNACETAALEPDKVINLVEGFMSRGASAVIGAEIMIFPSLAYEFGERFMEAFVTGHASLGTAIRQARLSLLGQWNPLGLAYVGYGLPELSLAPAAPALAALRPA